MKNRAKIAVALVLAATVASESQSPGRIGFVSQRDGSTEVYTIDPDGTDLRRISDKVGVYVLSGTIQLHTEFYGPETMSKGDSAYFDATMGHGYIRVGSEEATILCLMNGEGDFTPG